MTARGGVVDVSRALAEPIRVTVSGSGSPPLPVLARVAHVFSGGVATDVWPSFRRELAAGALSPGELVLLRIGRGTGEEWVELAVTTAA